MEVVAHAIGWTVHLLFMLGYWFLLSSPIWLVVWLIVDNKPKAGWF